MTHEARPVSADPVRVDAVGLCGWRASAMLDALDDLGPGVPDTRGMEKRGADGVEILVEKAVEACVVPPIAEQLLAAVCASEREEDGGCGEALEHLRALPPTALATALGKAPL